MHHAEAPTEEASLSSAGTARGRDDSPQDRGYNSGILEVVNLDQADAALAVSFVDNGGVGA